MQTKTCNRCNRELPATREYFTPNKLGKFGLRPDCKECAKRRAADYRGKHSESIRIKASHYYRTHKEQRREYYDRTHTPNPLTEHHKQLRLEGKRRCYGCKQEFPATPEYFVRRTGSPLDLSYCCKTCNQINSRQQYARLKARG